MKFAQLRKSKNLTQSQLAEKLGISNRTISMWETGCSTPKLKTVIRLAELLQSSKEEVLECFN